MTRVAKSPGVPDALSPERAQNDPKPWWSSASPTRHSRPWWMVWVTCALAAVVVAHMLDPWAWSTLRDVRFNDKDAGRLLRSIGYLPTWIIVAGALWLHDRGAPRWGWRGGLVVLAPALGGAVAELSKLLVRRARPLPDVFVYSFRPYLEDPLSTRGLGMPSSHVMVAFAGATMMARLFPRAWWLWYLLAAGCALTRVLTLGHFLSDVVVAALLGFVVGELLSRTSAFTYAAARSPSDSSATVRS